MIWATETVDSLVMRASNCPLGQKHDPEVLKPRQNSPENCMFKENNFRKFNQINFFFFYIKSSKQQPQHKGNRYLHGGMRNFGSNN